MRQVRFQHSKITLERKSYNRRVVVLENVRKNIVQFLRISQFDQIDYKGVSV